ncbi:RagB/SusD family nutrient uptake outer membrane protein [Pedobacter frigoris]|uniref:RagB/SusD family nutrient uptake outer membrane protein n=1 Tax=Pedobacter frigoris TaxID=2571272 RepID=UPI00292DF35D|nr:RagB/SusD family nutrient uptake outer membrane protein [Pedobacter frigoris]
MKANYQTFVKYIICFCSVILLFTSCKKGWLEEKSDKTLTVPLTLTEFQGLLDNVIEMNYRGLSLGEVASDGHYITEVYYQSIDPAQQQAEKDAYIWSKIGRHLSNNSQWDANYKKILTDNVILDGLKKISPGPLEVQQWKDIKGQALLNRASVFFNLAQVYAPPFDLTGNNNDLGIVLRTSSDITIPSKRSTVKETYEQILGDLNEAKNLLPIRPKILTRGSASAVNALMARVYLSMGDYANAFIAADNSLKQYAELLDYNDLSASASFIGRYNKEVIWHTCFVPSFPLSTWFIDADWFGMYSANDLRRTRFFRTNTNQSISFKGSYENTSAGSLFTGLATDEVYLTRAECYARDGKVAEALNDLNILMRKRWDNKVPFVPFVAANAEEALQLVLTERKKELLFRGIRWMDLRRLNKDSRFILTLKRTVVGVTYSLDPNSYKYVFPIPDNILEQTGIAQNPGW